MEFQKGSSSSRLLKLYGIETSVSMRCSGEGRMAFSALSARGHEKFGQLVGKPKAQDK